jgi:hypothetical protein
MYAEAGLYIFPVRRTDKRPAKTGYRRLRWSVEEVRAHWAENPDDNIGIDGEANGLVFLDVDAYKEGVSLRVEQMGFTEASRDQDTPSGGWHKIYRAAPGCSYKASLGTGIDIKHKGYIVLAPSSFSAKEVPYTLNSSWFLSGVCSKLPIAPQVMVSGTSTPGAQGSLSGALTRMHRSAMAEIYVDEKMLKALTRADNPKSITREQWLAVGHAMRDSYVGTIWEQQAHTAWVDWSADWEGASDDDVEHLVEEAYKVWPEDPQRALAIVHEARAKGQAVGFTRFRAVMKACGLTDADLDREPVAPPDLKEEPTAADWSWRTVPPPRRWLVESKLWRGKVTVFSGPGGVGKSSYTAGLAIDCALGRPVVLRDRVHETMTVLLWNGEDDRNETARKIHALLQHNEVDFDELGDRLHVHDKRSMRLDALNYLVHKPGGDLTELEEKRLDRLVEQILEIDPDLIILDPLVSMHGADENNNSAMEEVMGTLRGWLAETDPGKPDRAVAVVHHTKKQQVEMDKIDPADMARGASAINAAARAHYILMPLSELDAKKSRVPPAERRSYVKVLDAKNNLSRLSARTNTFRLLGVALGNGDEEHPDGDNVGAIEAYYTSERISDHHMALSVVYSMQEEKGADDRWWAKAVQSSQWVGHYIRDCLKHELEGGEEERTDTVKALIDYMVDHGLLLDERRLREGKGDRLVPGYRLAEDAELRVRKLAASLDQSEGGE